jgi:hypothetical protein
MSKVGTGDTEQTRYLKSARCNVEGIFVLQNRNRLQSLCRSKSPGLAGTSRSTRHLRNKTASWCKTSIEVTLQRHSDPIGLAEKTAALDSGERTIAALVEEVVHSAEYLSRFNDVPPKSAPTNRAAATTSC